MIPGHRLAEQAETFVATPFRHRGRRPGKALDCAGVMLCAAWGAGLRVPDFCDYGPAPDSQQLLREVEERCHAIDYGDAQPGDLLVFAHREGGKAVHFGMLDTKRRLIHAHGPTGCVVAHELTRPWIARLHSVWRFGGVGDG